MNTTIPEAEVSADAWWERRRLSYNLVLVAAAPISVLGLFFVWWLFEARLPCLEITSFSLMIGAFNFVAGLAFANLCYFLGPLSEKLAQPRNVSKFRNRVFAMGVAFSLLLIFFPVIANLLAAALYPSSVGTCVGHGA